MTTTLPAPTMEMVEGFTPQKLRQCRTCGSYTEHASYSNHSGVAGFRMAPFSKTEREFLGAELQDSTRGCTYTVVSLAPRPYGLGTGSEALWAYRAEDGEAVLLRVRVADRRIMSVEPATRYAYLPPKAA